MTKRYLNETKCLDHVVQMHRRVKMKKKVLSVLLASTMMAGILAGCGSSGSTDAP